MDHAFAKTVMPAFVVLRKPIHIKNNNYKDNFYYNYISIHIGVGNMEKI